MVDLDVRCDCGTVRAVIRDATPDNTNRVVCECGWCQRYAHLLERVDTMLDERGGTEVFQIRPSSLELLAGQDRLECMHLTSGGARRWYAGCCRSPIANTLAKPGPPFVGVLACCVDWTKVAKEEALGPVRVRVNGVVPPADRSRLRARRRDQFTMLGHYAPKFFGWWLRGEGKQIPFFDAAGQPIAEPERIRTEPVR